MICPSDYFTPKSIETAFAKSLGSSFVRNSVFGSAKKELATVPTNELDAVLQSAATVFLHYFIEQNSDEACVYDQSTDALRSIDDWVLRASSQIPSIFPTTERQAVTTGKLLASRFLFFDQELWILDGEQFSGIGSQDKDAKRVVMLIQRLDGNSLCFPRRIYPNDLGETMNSFAKRIAVQSLTGNKPKMGRPTKVDRAAEILGKTYPDGVKGINQGKVLRTVEKEMGESLGITSLRKAIKHTNSAHA